MDSQFLTEKTPRIDRRTQMLDLHRHIDASALDTLAMNQYWSEFNA
jgi:hypothetical protein